MDVMHIAPVAHLKELRDQHSHMALAHLVYEYPKYAQFYREMSDRGDFVLLDNGVAEGKELPWPVVCNAAIMVGAKEVVLPDVIGSCNFTHDATAAALEQNVTWHLRKKGVTLMGVPHGCDEEEWVKSMTLLLSLGVDTIGLSKFEIHHDPTFPVTGRFMMAHKVLQIRPKMQIHCLGNAGSPLELTFLRKTVRSYDSSIAFIAAKNDAVIRLKTGLLHPGTAGWSFDPTWKLSEEHLRAARSNMHVLEELAGHHGYLS